MTDNAGQNGVGASELAGYAAILLAVLIWASWIVATRDAASQFTPLGLSILRNAIPALILSPFWLRRGLFPRGESPWLLAIMAIGWGGPFILLTAKGLQTVPASLFAPLTPALLPLFVAIWDKFIDRRPFSVERSIGLGLIGLSVGLVLVPAFLDSEPGVLSGAPYLLAAAVSWSAFTIAYRRVNLNGVEAAAYVCLYSTPFLLIGSLFWETGIPQAPIADIAWAALMQGVLAGAISVAAFAFSAKCLGPVRASSFTALVPVFAALGGWAVLGETISVAGWLAAAAACLGVALANGAASAALRRRRR